MQHLIKEKTIIYRTRTIDQLFLSTNQKIIIMLGKIKVNEAE